MGCSGVVVGGGWGAGAFLQHTTNKFNCFRLRIRKSSRFIIQAALWDPAVEATSVLYSKRTLPHREPSSKHIMVSCSRPTALAWPLFTKQRRKILKEKDFFFSISTDVWSKTGFRFRTSGDVLNHHRSQLKTVKEGFCSWLFSLSLSLPNHPSVHLSPLEPIVPGF